MLPLASIPNAQRAPIPSVNLVRYGPSRAANQWAFITEVAAIAAISLSSDASVRKLDWAIEIAHRVGLQSIITAKVDRVDRAYYETRIRQLLKHPWIEFIGRMNERDKGAFLGGR
jgi:hypothetical protein